MNDILSKKLEQLNTLVELSFLINSTLDTREIRRRAIEAATRLLDAEAGSLLLIDQETGELFFEVALGEKGEKLKEIRLKKGEGIAGWVVEKGEPAIIRDVQSNHRFLRAVDEKSTFTTRDMVCVPVKTKDKVIGVLEVINKRHDFFDEDDKESLMALANHVAIAIENANLYQELKEAFYSTAMALAEAIEKRDPYTREHTKRVMDYSAAIGRTMGLSKKELEDLKLAAILHDVGKIGVRDSILLKGGKLDPDELEKMNMHSKYGAEILSHVKQLKDIIPGVRGHHERFDGKGYPDNLNDGDISIIARIVAVADTFDAMTTDRPYRKALSFGTAFEELRKNIGTQFDGEVVEAFIRHGESEVCPGLRRQKI
ncbi:MAG: HD-GYP domain-containing protein [Thermodesulfovibrionales bacterium]|nr:HD-GYP domain-containing protein [Thermodesulfovibrionales bacterium]